MFIFPTLISNANGFRLVLCFFLRSMININVTFTTNFTRAMIPVLQKSKNSLIYMLSSFSGIVPVGMMPVYSATKAYNDVLARALAAELAPTGVTVKSVVPHFVVSAMSGFSRATWAVPDAVSFAHATIAKTGIWDVSIAPHWWHDLTMRIASAAPDFLIGGFTVKQMKAARVKLMRRAEKKAAEKAAAAQ